MRNVLVAIDETEASARVAAFVDTFFKGLDGMNITAVHVGTVPMPWGAHAALPGSTYAWRWGVSPIVVPDPAAEIEAVEGVREEGREILESVGPAAGDRVVELAGDVTEALRDLCARLEADLLVLGSSHKNLLQRIFEPSVSKHLIDDAPVPVLVVH